MKAIRAAVQVRRDNPKWAAGALAFGVHAVFVLLLVFGVSWQTEHPAPVMVDLWQSLPKAESPPVAVKPSARTPPAPKPAPAPKPEADELPSPQAPDIALEKEKQRAETARLKKLMAVQEAEEQARKDAARAEADALKQVRDKQAAEQKQQALLRQMEADELKQSMANESAANAARTARQAEARAAGARQAALSQITGKYKDMISAKVYGNTRPPDNLQGNPQVDFLVKLLPTGQVVDVRPLKSSGNPAYDQAVERAIRKSSPLPLPDDREARAEFVPELKFSHRYKE